MAEIKSITVNELRLLEGHEGLLIEGCARLDDWVQSITEALTQAGILLNGSQFQNISTFLHDGLTYLLFDFEGAELDIEKFAAWRLETHSAIGGTLLSDFVQNWLGGFVHEQEHPKPDDELIGENGNIFNRKSSDQAPVELPAMTKYALRPASLEEAGLFYAMTPEEDSALGCIGHVRMDFGHRGKEFWHTWWPRGPEELNSPAFKEELGGVVDAMRETVLKDLTSMQHYCSEHGGEIPGGFCTQNHGYVVETEHYRYCLRCNPIPGDYQAYLTCYDLKTQRENMGRLQETKPVVGRLTFANGEVMEFTDAKEYLEKLKAEFDCIGVTGLTYETLTDNPQTRKAVDDLVCGLFGDENSRPVKDYQTSLPTMQMGGM